MQFQTISRTTVTAYILKHASRPSIVQFLQSLHQITNFNSLPKDKISDWSKLKQIADDILTLSQTTGFKLFQTEIVCRGQFQI